jgi:hypothetical protein
MISTSWHRFLHQVQLVAGEQHRGPLRGQAGQQLGHGLQGDRVLAGERLVEYQQVRLVDQGGDQLNPLLVSC